MSQSGTPLIALLGNPNCGKTSIFNYLTGFRQKTGNYPGVTVEIKSGKTSTSDNLTVDLLDMPGAYSLYPSSEDERIVSDALIDVKNEFHPDAIIYVADINNLEKHLLLFSQVQDLEIPAILLLNFSDKAEKEGLKYDITFLEKHLDTRILETSVRSGKNMDQLKKLMGEILETPDLFKRKKPFYSLSNEERQIAGRISSQPINDHFQLSPYKVLNLAHRNNSLKSLTAKEKEDIETILLEEKFDSLRFQIHETMQRYDHFSPIVKNALVHPATNERSWTSKIDSIATHKIFGPFVFLLLMFLVFQAIYSWSTYPMEWIESFIIFASNNLRALLPAGWFSDLLTDGLLAGLGGVLVFIPQIAVLFILISILEEVGYMARAVFIFDRIMQRFGLNGRSMVALISGGACAIPAIMSTRTINNWKERLITIMVTPLISCSARIPVYTVLIGFAVPSIILFNVINLQGIAFMGLYLLGILAALISAWVFKMILKSPERSFLLIELPEYRVPVMRNVLMNTYEKVKTFTFEAGKVIIVISIILWALASYGPGDAQENAELAAIEIAEQQQLGDAEKETLIASSKIRSSYAGYIGRVIEPFIQPLGFDWKIGIALITSFAAREVFVGTMATIYSVGSEDALSIREHMAKEKNPVTGMPVYTLATSFSLLIFYVFALQCMSTLAVVKRETNSWKWPAIQFIYMGGMAYFASFICYQLLK